MSHTRVTEMIRTNWEDRMWRNIGGAALTIGGTVAAIHIGAPRLAPMAAATAGLAIFVHSLLSQPRKAPHLAGRVAAGEQNKWALWKSALAILTLAIPIYYGTRWAGCTPADVFKLDSSNPQRKMSAEFQGKDSISSLNEINGKPIEIIEKRARGKFLGQEESLKDVLQHDWKTVNALGTTHIELGNNLKAILDSTSNQCSQYCNTDTILHNPQNLENSTIGHGSQTQILQVCRLDADGLEQNVFSPYDLESTPNVLYDHFDGPSYFIIKNPLNGESVVGRLSMIDYIKKYGFYGGHAGAYRIDPVRLASILTGQNVETVRKAIS